MSTPRRLDQRVLALSSAGSGPSPQNFVVGRFIIVATPGGGLFVYNGTPATGNLIESVAAANGTDPYGNAFFKGTATYSPSAGHSLVITLLSTANNAFFQYANPSGGVQGALIGALAGASGTDPITGTTYLAGFTARNPAFGDRLNVIGADVLMNQLLYTRPAELAANTASGPSGNPFVLISAPEQTTAHHMQMLLQGDSPDGTAPSQWLLGRVAGATILTPVANAMAEIQDSTGNGGVEIIGQVAAPVHALLIILAAAAGDRAIAVSVSGDTISRWRIDSNGFMQWSLGSGSFAGTLFLLAANQMAFQNCDLSIHTAGRGLQVAEGVNAKQGTATLGGGTVTVANTSVTANSRIFLTAQDNNSTGALRISARVAGTSFTITSSNAADSGVVAFEIFEPG